MTSASHKPRQVAYLETEVVCALIALDRYDEIPVLAQDQLIMTVGHRIATATHLVINAGASDEADLVLESARQRRPASSAAEEWIAIIQAVSEDLNAARSLPRATTQPAPIT